MEQKVLATPSPKATSPEQAGYQGPERRIRPPVLGMRLRDFDIRQAAEHMLSVRRSAKEGVGLFVTPNIQHIALARNDPEFDTAMKSAPILVADGFPVYRYALSRGLYLPGRVTGREVVGHMFSSPEKLAGHRGYFVVDSDETASKIEEWAAANFPGFALKTHVPPFGFENDAQKCLDLVKDINNFDTSLLFLCVGAPKSEVFVHRHSAVLCPCWALCVGQSFRLLIGSTTMPPAFFVKFNLEWLWRLALEPGRMLRRYVPSAIGFIRAALDDMLWSAKPKRTAPPPVEPDTTQP